MGRNYKNEPPMKREILLLLGDLCVVYGFCIPPEDNERISSQEYLEAEEFADEVLRAEGMVPEYEKKWRKLIREQFINKFGTSIAIGDFEAPET